MYAHHDPLTDVPCSLLSSAEIHDYVRLTGMLHPFDENALKSASYEAHIGGEMIWWDERGEKHAKQIGRGDPCVLDANSITFVQVEPLFRLPDYIAIRFNLRITHVHRGLLLGTGPLVDPGFEGRLLIPLHNLTASKYDLDTRDALIWIEFTKTTFGFVPKDGSHASQQRHFTPFPAAKKNLLPDQYLRKASGGQPIRSSIPDAMEKSRIDAETAATSATRAATSATQMRNLVGGIGAVAVLSLIVALVALYVQVANLVQGSVTLSRSVDQQLSSLVADGKTTVDKLQKSEAQVERIGQQTEQFGRDLELLRQRVPTSGADQIERLTQQVEQLRRELVEILKQLPPGPSPPRSRP
jgi:deoxycytidine triphosphate deaminase